jgi:DNA-directed RNA polymerase
MVCAQRRIEHRALWDEFTMKVAMAEEHTHIEKFYYPYNMDFRGRAYTMVAHLSHIGVSAAGEACARECHRRPTAGLQPRPADLLRGQGAGRQRSQVAQGASRHRVYASSVQRTLHRAAQVHFANVFGNDKISIDERVAFADSRMADIVRCAEAPLEDDNRWWMEAAEPFQCLVRTAHARLLRA